MQNNWLNAFVLHRRPYRETSFIVDFFTLELGRVSAVARGVRSAKSDRRSLLQPFQALRVQLSGKGDLKNLTQLESNGGLTMLSGDALYCALYVNELTNRVLPAGLEATDLYTSYASAITALQQQVQGAEFTLRQYEMALLQELGVMPDFTCDAASGDAIAMHSHYELVPELGFCAVKLPTRFTFSGEELHRLAQGELDETALKAAKRLCRLALHPFVGDKPLKSRELFLASR
ncbi:DNA repair protein RecO [Alteromonas lipolytica]|uniref:DNA repair protein RecO n=1 Tax=Alteromonas lipolytica TaxID=1856405 RepID=A0A1E8FDC7_9ALTE|nr:DNA repair protein RecO [Alteromonas lipolytica]OFI33766.1 DNA repair protein RecO [Alteromonas lipolytica]GGF68571.1 DNA repair protein RecO [Alteromonas lipolytica]